MDVIEQRRRAGESLVSHQLLGVEPAVGLPERDVPLARDRAERVVDRASEIPAQRLLALDRLEQRLEVALAEALRALALDDLVEHASAGPRPAW